MKNRIDKQIDAQVKEFIEASGGELTEREAKYIVVDTMFDDLPDGAYFAAMAEYGYEPEDIIELSEKLAYITEDDDE